jgi:DMSO/TMAO reductase YedYZ molybdopterin-dependent catalytic subunit
VKAVSRRDFLTRSVLGCAGFLAVRRAWNQTAKPEISSFDLSLLDEWLTPNSLFFVRDHFPAPATSTDNWKLSVGGAPGSPFEISYDDLLRQPRRTLAVTLECAENPAGGGLVSHAEWNGVSIAGLLAKAQPQSESGYVRLRGADGYSRTIPMAKALHPDTLLALTMNGERLPAAHGFPVRALVPGWYGMDSVKWLQAIEVLSREEDVTQAYRRVLSRVGGNRDAGPVAAMEVKSVFSRPSEGAILLGRRFMVRGAAWAGEKKVGTVEVSTDGGHSWETARFSPLGPPSPQPYAWAHWEYDWKIRGPGSYELACRATDESGRVQPARRPADRVDDYELNTCQIIRVSAV